MAGRSRGIPSDLGLLSPETERESLSLGVVTSLG